MKTLMSNTRNKRVILGVVVVALVLSVFFINNNTAPVSKKPNTATISPTSTAAITSTATVKPTITHTPTATATLVPEGNLTNRISDQGNAYVPTLEPIGDGAVRMSGLRDVEYSVADILTTAVYEGKAAISIWRLVGRSDGGVDIYTADLPAKKRSHGFMIEENFERVDSPSWVKTWNTQPGVYISFTAPGSYHVVGHVFVPNNRVPLNPRLWQVLNAMWLEGKILSMYLYGLEEIQ